MDYTIIYVLGIIAITVGILALSKFASKYGLLNNDILFTIIVLKLGISVIDELKLKNEKEIRLITKVVIDSLEFAIAYYKEPENILKYSIEYAFEQCITLEIELTDERKYLIEKLLEIGFNNKYINRIK
jgi:hypothetical protein